MRLPGFVAAAYQHETSRAGDPHLHTHVLLPNRQARSDGALVSYDSKSLHHEAKVRASSTRPRCAASCTNRWAWSRFRSTRIPGSLRLLAWLATPSARRRSVDATARVGQPRSRHRRGGSRHSGAVGGPQKAARQAKPARATRSFQQPKQPTLLTCADRATGLGDLAGNAQAVSFASSRSLDRSAVLRVPSSPDGANHRRLGVTADPAPGALPVASLVSMGPKQGPTTGLGAPSRPIQQFRTALTS